MTLAEFKAWFEGFTESMDGTPSAKQWKRIKARVKEIDGAPITERVYIDRYRPNSIPYWQGPVTICGDSSNASAEYDTAVDMVWNSTNAIYAAGQADYIDGSGR